MLICEIGAVAKSVTYLSIASKRPKPEGGDRPHKKTSDGHVKSAAHGTKHSHHHKPSAADKKKPVSKVKRVSCMFVHSRSIRKCMSTYTMHTYIHNPNVPYFPNNSSCDEFTQVGD